MANNQTNDFTEWYLQTVQQAELMSYSPVRGSIIFRPDGYELWEHIQEEFNKFLRNEGIRNAYFPMLIPKHFFMKEADHIEGFAPELPWVTEVGDEKLEVIWQSKFGFGNTVYQGANRYYLNNFL